MVLVYLTESLEKLGLLNRQDRKWEDETNVVQRGFLLLFSALLVSWLLISCGEIGGKVIVMWDSLRQVFSSTQDELSNYRLYIDTTYRDGKLIGRPFPIIDIETGRGNTIQVDFSKKKGGLVMLSDITSCQPCAEMLLNTLNYIYKNIEDPMEFPIYGIAINTSQNTIAEYKRSFKIEYTLGVLIQEGVLSPQLTENTPIIFLVGPNNTILHCHNPTFGKEQFSALFFYDLVFNRLSFLDVNTKDFERSALIKLDDKPVLEIIKGNYDRSSLSW